MNKMIRVVLVSFLWFVFMTTMYGCFEDFAAVGQASFGACTLEWNDMTW